MLSQAHQELRARCLFAESHGYVIGKAQVYINALQAIVGKTSLPADITPESPKHLLFLLDLVDKGEKKVVEAPKPVEKPAPEPVKETEPEPVVEPEPVEEPKDEPVEEELVEEETEEPIEAEEEPVEKAAKKEAKAAKAAKADKADKDRKRGQR